MASAMIVARAFIVGTRAVIVCRVTRASTAEGRRLSAQAVSQANFSLWKAKASASIALLARNQSSELSYANAVIKANTALKVQRLASNAPLVPTRPRRDPRSVSCAKDRRYLAPRTVQMKVTYVTVHGRQAPRAHCLPTPEDGLMIPDTTMTLIILVSRMTSPAVPQARPRKRLLLFRPCFLDLVKVTRTAKTLKAAMTVKPESSLRQYSCPPFSAVDLALPHFLLLLLCYDD